MVLCDCSERCGKSHFWNPCTVLCIGSWNGHAGGGALLEMDRDEHLPLPFPFLRIIISFAVQPSSRVQHDSSTQSRLSRDRLAINFVDRTSLSIPPHPIPHPLIPSQSIIRYPTWFQLYHHHHHHVQRSNISIEPLFTTLDINPIYKVSEIIILGITPFIKSRN